MSTMLSTEQSSWDLRLGTVEERNQEEKGVDAFQSFVFHEI